MAVQPARESASQRAPDDITTGGSREDKRNGDVEANDGWIGNTTLTSDSRLSPGR